jgi:hypothetical protein
MKRNILKEKYGIEFVGYCSCGAYTVTINGIDYSCHKDNIQKFFPDIDMVTLEKAIENNYYNCNHCCNHWGLDLCACGSGESPEECEGSFNECGSPSQSIENGYNHVQAKNGWGY